MVNCRWTGELLPRGEGPLSTGRPDTIFLERSRAFSAAVVAITSKFNVAFWDHFLSRIFSFPFARSRRPISLYLSNIHQHIETEWRCAEPVSLLSIGCLHTMRGLSAVSLVGTLATWEALDRALLTAVKHAHGRL